jgi:hypothetical protein
MGGALVLLLVLVAIPIAAAIWLAYLSNGTSTAVTILSPDEVLDATIDTFVPADWRVAHRTNALLVLERPASGCAGLFLLLVFFPLGLVYLLTPWGRGKLTLQCWPLEDEETDVQLRWSSAAIRSDAKRFLEWLETEEEEEADEEDGDRKGGDQQAPG